MSRGSNALESLFILESLDVLDFLERSPVVFLISLSAFFDLIVSYFWVVGNTLDVAGIPLDGNMMDVKHL